MAQTPLPTWIAFWLGLTSAICTWDAGFILLRPDSLPGGSLHTFWKPYQLYITVDHKYADMQDVFVYAQSCLNMVEVLLNMIALYLNVSRNRNAIPLAFMVCIMTWWKTVLYLLQYVDFVDKGVFSNSNDLKTRVLLFWIPNGIWVVVPFVAIVALWGNLVSGQERSSKKRQ